MRYVPPFICDKYQQQMLNGSFEGYILNLDIADFTGIVANMQKQGKDGAEHLHRMLITAFTKPLEAVSNAGGFVSGFAGDAFTAVFAGASADQIIALATELEEFLSLLGKNKTTTANIPIDLHIAITYGAMHWKIYPGELLNDYIFYGDAFDALHSVKGKLNLACFTESAAQQIGKVLFSAEENVYYLKKAPQSLNDLSKIDGTDGKINLAVRSSVEQDADPAETNCQCKINLVVRSPLKEISSESVNSFTSGRFQDIRMGNEFREGCFCFINLSSIEEENLLNTLNTIHRTVESYGGYANKLDYSDKGLVLLIFFGLPVQTEKTLKRTIGCAMEVIKTNAKLAIGIGCGSVYSGLTGSEQIYEYTALGFAVNLASRLMHKANHGEILVDEYINSEMAELFSLRYKGNIILKGFESAIKYYAVTGSLEANRGSHNSTFVGRLEESDRLSQYIRDCMQSGTSAVIYVSGDAGIGKSRLINEVLTGIPEQSGIQFFAACDDMIVTPLNVIRKMVRKHFYYNPDLPVEAGKMMFQGLWAGFAAGDPDMTWLESVMGSLVGYTWADSIWENTPNADRAKLLQMSFNRFLITICRQKPVLLSLDDAQWIDAASLDFLRSVDTFQLANPFIIVAACRYTDIGERVDLQLDVEQDADPAGENPDTQPHSDTTGFASYHLDLHSIDESFEQELICSILRIKTLPADTYSFIRSKTMGNPLFTGQITNFLIENRYLAHDGKLVSLPDDITTYSISEIISSRVDRLSHELQDIILYASVLGVVFDLKVLSAMLKHNLTVELCDGEKYGIWKDLDELHYIFTHVLIKDTIYHRMLKSKLISLHKIAAECYQQIYTDDVSPVILELVYHLEHAEEWEKVVDAVLSIKKKDVHSSVYNQFVTKAFGIATDMELKDATKKCLLLERYYEVLYDIGEFDKSIEMQVQAIDIKAQNLSDHKAIQDCLKDMIALGNLVLVTRGVSAAIVYLQRAEAIVVEYRNVLKLHTISRLGTLYEWAHRFEDAARVYQILLTLSLERENVLFQFASLASIIRMDKDTNSDLQSKLFELWVLYQQKDDERYDVYFDMAQVYHHLKDYDNAINIYLKLLEKLRGKDSNSQYIFRNLAGVYYDKGDYYEAIKCLENALNLIEKVMGKQSYFYYVTLCKADSQFQSRNFQAAKSTIELCLEHLSMFPQISKITLYRTASQVYQSLQDWHKAKLYLTQLVTAYDIGIEVEDIDDIKKELAEIEKLEADVLS